MAGWRLRVLAVTVAALLLVGVAALVTERRENTGGSAWSRLADIAYLVPEGLPEGWTFAYATERQARPREQWAFHAEILATADRRRFVVLQARTSLEPAHHGACGQGPVRDARAEDLQALFQLTVGSMPDGLEARSVYEPGDKVNRVVTELSAAPDDAFLLRLGCEMDHDELDFGLPRSLRRAGFERLGSANDAFDDVTDYTAVWAPAERAGADRAAATAMASREGPHLSLNVGSRFYGQAQKLPTDVKAARIRREGDTLEMRFTIDGSPVRLGATGIEEAALRAVATKLRTVSSQEWRRQLGDRLLVQPPAPPRHRA